MAGRRQTVDQWIHEMLTDTEQGKECTSLALMHLVSGRGEQEVYTLKLAGRQWDAAALGKVFYSKAENYAAELSGNQRFNLLAFFDNSGQPGSLKPFNVNGQLEFEGLATEPPTKDGHAAQQMRHTEAIIQMCFRQTAMLFERSQAMTHELMRENMELRAQARDAAEIVRDVILKQAESAHANNMKELQFARDTEERKKWFSFGPALINNLLGRDVFPQSTADTALVEAIAESLTEEDIGKLAQSGIIKPEIWGPLAARMSATLERKRLAKEQMNAITKHLNPEEDATGMAAE